MIHWRKPALLVLTVLGFAALMLVLPYLNGKEVNKIRGHVEELAYNENRVEVYESYLSNSGFMPVSTAPLLRSRTFPGQKDFKVGESGIEVPCAMWPPDWLLSDLDRKQCYSKSGHRADELPNSESILVCYVATAPGNVTNISVGHVDHKLGRGTWAGALFNEDMASDLWCGIRI